MGLVWTIWSSRDTFPLSLAPSLAPTIAKYEMTFFVFSVLPAPDSPLKGKIREVYNRRLCLSRHKNRRNFILKELHSRDFITSRLYLLLDPPKILILSQKISSTPPRPGGNLIFRLGEQQQLEVVNISIWLLHPPTSQNWDTCSDISCESSPDF